MGNFSTIDPYSNNIPFTGQGTDPDALALRNPDSTLSGQSRGTQSIGGTTNIISDPTNQRIKVNDGTNDRIFFGKISQAGAPIDWGLKISKPGFDINAATPDQLIFNSSQDTFKIVTSDTITDTTGRSFTTPGVGMFDSEFYTIGSKAHGLGYVPAVVGFMGSGSLAYTPLPNTFYQSFGGTSAAWITYYMQVTSTTVTVYLQVMTTGSTPINIGPGNTFKYYLLQESAA